MAFTKITRVTKTLTSGSTWQDIDVSANVPAGATVVYGEIECVSGSRTAGVRKNGSTDNRTNAMNDNTHFGFAVGVDSSRIFEGFAGDTAQVKFYIDGYSTSDAVAFTNGVDKSLSATAAWTDISIASDTGSDTAIAAVIERVSGGSDYDWGLRKNGSTDNRTNLASGAHTHAFGLIGCDGSEIFEGYIQNTSVDFFLLAYLVNGFTANTNGIDRSQTNLNVYEDLTLSTGAKGASIEVISTDFQAWALRENGTSIDVYRNNARHCWWIGPADSSGIIEGKISTTNVDYFETGIFTAVATTTIPNKILQVKQAVNRASTY